MSTSSPQIQQSRVLSKGHFTLTEYTFTYPDSNGKTQTQNREIYDVGNAATVLLYNKETKKVILTKQFRLATFVNGNPNGMMIETCAGKLDGDKPSEAILREIEEETGYKVNDVQHVFEAYMSPGSLTELLHFYIAAYTPAMKVSQGSGLEEEQEDIKVLELHYSDALQMIAAGQIKDAKTIMLLYYAQATGLLG